MCRLAISELAMGALVICGLAIIRLVINGLRKTTTTTIQTIYFGFSFKHRSDNETCNGNHSVLLYSNIIEKKRNRPLYIG